MFPSLLDVICYQKLVYEWYKGLSVGHNIFKHMISLVPIAFLKPNWALSLNSSHFLCILCLLSFDPNNASGIYVVPKKCFLELTIGLT